jgi:hypothetical protein
VKLWDFSVSYSVQYDCGFIQSVLKTISYMYCWSVASISHQNIEVHLHISYMPYIVVLRYSTMASISLFYAFAVMKLFNLMRDFKYLCLWLETYMDNWYWFLELNLYAKHGMFMLIMSALLTLLMWALCNYWNRVGNRWSYFNSTADWFYKHMFKLLENLCYLCKSADMVNMKASCPLHPNMLGQACQTEGPPRAIWVTFVLSWGPHMTCDPWAACLICLT